MGIDFYSDELYRRAERVGDILQKRHWRLGTAESCTGGGLGYALTSVRGSSNWYLGGVVSYSNEFKRDFLGVATGLLDEFGAVSEQVAVAMAVGICSRSGSEAGIAVTGVAGPDGGTATKPVGMVWVGCFDVERGSRSLQLNLTGSRNVIRQGAIEASMNFFLDDL